MIAGRPFAAALLLATLQAAAAGDMRLAGTMAYGDGQWLAVVEQPDGGQRLVRVNDRIDGGTVVGIAERTVRVRYADGERIYVLEGGRTIATWEARPVAPGTPVIASRHIDAAFVKSLEQLQSRMGEGRPEERRAEMYTLLGLPAQARIKSLNQAKVAGDVQLLAAIRRNIRTGVVNHLFLEGSSQLDEVYLLPHPPAEP